MTYRSCFWMRPARSEAVSRARPRVWWRDLSRGLLAGIALWLSTPEGAAAQEGDPDAPRLEREPAAECCLVLLLPVGARAVALGRALTASGSPDAAFANPAGLAAVEADQFLVHHTTLAGQATALSLILTPADAGTIGLSYQLLDFGEIENTDEFGRTVGALTIRHHLFVASFATGIVGGLAAGVNYKLYQFKIGCSGLCSGEEVAATTHAIDAGIRYRSARLPALQLGAAISNVGFALQVVNVQQADPLPVRLRLGAAYEALHHLFPNRDIEFWIALDVEDRWRELGDPVASVGVELVANNAAFLRAGYVPGEGVGTGASVGIGIDYSRFTVGVAKSFAGAALEANGDPVQVSFGLRFE